MLDGAPRVSREHNVDQVRVFLAGERGIVFVEGVEPNEELQAIIQPLQCLVEKLIPCDACDQFVNQKGVPDFVARLLLPAEYVLTTRVSIISQMSWRGRKCGPAREQQ